MAGLARGGETAVIQKAALPLHVQKLQQALNPEQLIRHVERLFGAQDEIETELEILTVTTGTTASRQTASNARLYNFTHVTDERKWVQDLLLSDSDASDLELSESDQLQIVLELHYNRRKRWKKRLKRDPGLWRYKYFSSGLLSSHDRYPSHLKRLEEQLTGGRDFLEEGTELSNVERQVLNLQKEKERYRQRLWSFIVKKEIPKVAKQFSTARHNTVANNKRIAQLCQREVRKVALKSQRAGKEVSLQPRARRLMREALTYWRRYERVEKEQRRRAEKEALEQRKIDDEMREARRQQRKLNFLITQTELYAHFIANKLTGESDAPQQILQKLEDTPLQREVRPGMVVELEAPGEYDSEALKAQALANVQSAVSKQEEANQAYMELVEESSTDLQQSFDNRYSLATPVLSSEKELPQPSMFRGQLKIYQLKGMNWLANLYDQGINGILADEMGLGKTVQSIALLAHLSERQGIWGPFLIVAPASTLHNWQQECTRFVPRFKVLPYWGSPHERKIIRKYWNQKLLHKENAPFHILITSYQLVVQDIKYFQRVKWQYMILDEAQAIKSSTSLRWKMLLSFNCRNRLLLTGTPIQNTMQELWALLHFVMPTMFDSHEEFNEWFSRDIESHAEKKSALDENQLSRLHMILKPFMLRRIKRDVEHEMAEKIEVHLSCDLSTRQRRLYHGLRQRISIEDLFQSSAAQTNSSRDSSSSHLLNLVMQFRKVCNHPDLFERRDVKSPISVPIPSYIVPRMLYHEMCKVSVGLQRLLTVTLGAHTTDRIHHSSLADSTESTRCWSFLRLTDTTPQEASAAMLGSLAARFCAVLSLMERVHLLYQQRLWHSRARKPRTQLLLWPSFRTSPPAVSHSPALRDLVFTSHTGTTYTHTTHRVFPMKTSATTSAELMQISHTISNVGKKDEGEQSPLSSRDSVKDPSPASDSTVSSNSNSGSLVSLGGSSHQQRVVNGLNHTVTGTCTSNLPCYSGGEVLVSGKNSATLLKNAAKEAPFGRDSSEQSSSSAGMVNQNGIPDHSGESGMETEPQGAQNTEASPSSENKEVTDSGSRTSPQLEVTPHSQYPYMPTSMPNFLIAYAPRVQVPPNPMYCSDRGVEHVRVEQQSGGPQDLKQVLYSGTLEPTPRCALPALLHPAQPAGVGAVQPPTGWSYIHIPDKDNMIYDSGKMAVLDKLLDKLKKEGHRVLVYSQMTRMIDLLEEFMNYRRYRYIRLDGSSRIADRRDMVDDFQTKSDIFVFLLSTRAGGLGINLTAADTVVFFDSDWNPTVDQQAMDRAHRLGQTKQVTVYRLVVKGTIEERILQRAREKSEIQRMVISGADFKPDALKPKEMVSLLLDDDEMETRFLAKQAEKAQEQQGKKGKGKKRKHPPGGRDGEPLLKRSNPGLVSSTPSPLIFSRPDSVMSSVSELNGEDAVDVVGSTDGSEMALSEISRPGSTPVRHRGRTAAPLGGRGRIQRKKVGGPSSSAAAAGALAGALAASNATYAAYGISPHRISPSPINSVTASPVSALQTVRGSSAQSSPRVSPIPSSFIATHTPPSSKTVK